MVDPCAVCTSYRFNFKSKLTSRVASVIGNGIDTLHIIVGQLIDCSESGMEANRICEMWTSEMNANK